MNTRYNSPLSIAVLLLAVAIFPLKPVIADAPRPEIGSVVETDQIQASIQFNGCSPVYLVAVNEDYEQQVAELVNIERLKVGLPPLKRVSTLDNAARFHAKDMAVDSYFKHDSYDRSGSELYKVCGWADRVGGFYPSWSWLGENIAAGYGTPESVMQGWMNSVGHRGNILHSEYREFGVGYYQGGPYGSYWVQDFGEQSNSYPLIVNNERAVTENPLVELYLYGDGVWNEMRLKNDNGVWSEWKPFQVNIQWSLDWVKGQHTVWVEVRKTGQISAGATSSDTIELTTSGAALGNLPNEIVFIYNQETRELIPGNYQLQPLNTLSDLPLEWQVVSQANWIKLSTSSGVTPSSMTTIQPGDDILQTAGQSTGSITVTVQEDIQASGSPKEIGVRLYVVPSMSNHIYLPSIKR